MLAIIVTASVTVSIAFISSAQAVPPLLYANQNTYTGDSPRWHYRVVKRVEQDRALFTQGMQFDGDQLYLSSGLYGVSRIVRFDAGNKLTQVKTLPADVFAEGLAIGNNTLHVLTWHEQKILRFERDSLTARPPLAYSGEGWGLTFDGKQLIRSDGSNTVFFHDTNDFRVLHSIQVHDGNQPVQRLNELEWVNGLLLANIWVSNTIVVIDPSNGNVTAQLDLNGLLPATEMHDDTDVLNGIAWDAKNQWLWVTGKRWPARFALAVDELVQDRKNPK